MPESYVVRSSSGEAQFSTSAEAKLYKSKLDDCETAVIAFVPDSDVHLPGRRGPKMSQEGIVAKVLDLESRLLEYQRELLNQPDFVSFASREKFELSSRQRKVQEAWDAWLKSERKCGT
jgi:hypothetical protein